MTPSAVLTALALRLGALCGGVLVSMACAAQAADFKPQRDQPGKDVVWVPTPDALVDTMLELGKVGAADTVIDLGSGDGRLVIMAAQRGARALGIEYDARLVDYAKAAAIKAGVANHTQFVKADLFASDFSQATVVTLFLGPDLNRKLLPKLLSLRPGTRIVSNTHPIGDWPADETAHSSDDQKSVYYRTARLWIVPANVRGVWQTPLGPLRITQRYQTIDGTLDIQGKRSPIRGELRGNQVRFVAADTRYAGVVKDAVIIGTATRHAGAEPWRATRVP